MGNKPMWRIDMLFADGPVDGMQLQMPASTLMAACGEALIIARNVTTSAIVAIKGYQLPDAKQALVDALMELDNTQDKLPS